MGDRSDDGGVNMVAVALAVAVVIVIILVAAQHFLGERDNSMGLVCGLLLVVVGFAFGLFLLITHDEDTMFKPKDD